MGDRQVPVIQRNESNERDLPVVAVCRGHNFGFGRAKIIGTEFWRAGRTFDSHSFVATDPIADCSRPGFVSPPLGIRYFTAKGR